MEAKRAWLLIHRAWIIGVVTSQGEVRSVCVDFEKAKMHGDYFANFPHAKRWRWDWTKSLRWSFGSEKPDAEESESVRRHITRKYGIQWWDNGHHDIDKLMAQART